MSHNIVQQNFESFVQTYSISLRSVFTNLASATVLSVSYVEDERWEPKDFLKNSHSKSSSLRNCRFCWGPRARTSGEAAKTSGEDARKTPSRYFLPIPLTEFRGILACARAPQQNRQLRRLQVVFRHFGQKRKSFSRT